MSDFVNALVSKTTKNDLQDKLNLFGQYNIVLKKNITFGENCIFDFNDTFAKVNNNLELGLGFELKSTYNIGAIYRGTDKNNHSIGLNFRVNK